MFLSSWLDSIRTVVGVSEWRARRSIRRQALRYLPRNAAEQLEERIVPVNPPTISVVPLPLPATSNATGTSTINLSSITNGDGGNLSAGQVSISSVTNPQLLKNLTLTFPLPGFPRSGTLTYQPNTSPFNPGLFGSSTVTLLANDGVDGPTFLQFDIQINDKPTITPQPNAAAILEDSPTQTFTLKGITAGGGTTAVVPPSPEKEQYGPGADFRQQMSITATSDDVFVTGPITVSNYNTFTGTATLQYTPVPNAPLSRLNNANNPFDPTSPEVVTITVTVTDSGSDGLLGSGDDGVTYMLFDVRINAVNDLPTLDSIVVAPVDEDSGFLSVPLTNVTAGGFSPDQATGSPEPQPLYIYFVNDNPSLVSIGQIPQISYPVTSSNVPITFLPDQFGTATIEIHVQDGGLDENLATTADNLEIVQVFSLVVNAVNDLPTLTSLPDITLKKDAGNQSVSLKGISTGGGEIETLQITATSDNQTLLPDPTIIFVQGRPDGKLGFRSNVGQTGTANVTVEVRDPGLDTLFNTVDDGITTRTFAVHVHELPTLDNVAPINLLEDAGPQTILLTGISAGPGEFTQPVSVTVTSSNTSIIPTPAVTYTSGDTSGSLDYTPVAGKSGDSVLTITVTDGGLDNTLGIAGKLKSKLAFNAPVLLLKDASNFPSNAAVPFKIQIGAEYLLVTTVNGNSFNILRGIDGTTPATHEVNDLVIPPVGFDDLTIVRTVNVHVEPVNDPPTLNLLIPAPFIVIEDSGLHAISLSGIADGEGNTQPLRVKATTSDPSLIRNLLVAYTSNMPTGTLFFETVLNAVGTATITVEVEDGGLDGDLDTLGDNGHSVPETVTVIVSAAPDTPTLNPLSGPLTILEGAAQQSISLTGITDGDGNTQPIMVTVTSSNPTLIAAPTVDFNLSNLTPPNVPSTGTLKFTPTALRNGSAILSVFVTDGGLDGDLLTLGDNKSFLRELKVIVVPVDDPPRIGVPGKLATDMAIADLMLMVSDASPFPATATPPFMIQVGGEFMQVTNIAGTIFTVSRTTPAVHLMGDSVVLPVITTMNVPENQGNALPSIINLFGIDAGLNESQTMRVTVRSGNSTIISNAVVSNFTPPTGLIPGSGRATISFTPAAHLTGDVYLYVTVADAGPDGNIDTGSNNGVTNLPILIHVTPINDLPTVNPATAARTLTGTINPTTPTLTLNSGTGFPTTATPNFNIVVDTEIMTVTNITGNNFTVIRGVNGTAAATHVANAPAYLPITVAEDSGLSAINLTGITAGPNEFQILKVTSTVVASSIPGLIASTSVEYASANSTGTLKFTPAANLFGTATIRVTVEDAGLDGRLDLASDNARDFRDIAVVVTGSVDLPTLTQPAPLTINEDGAGLSGNMLTLTGISDGDLNTQPLSITVLSSNTALVPTPTLSFTQSSTKPLATPQTATLTFNGLAAQQTGTSQIYVTITDGGADGVLGTSGALATGINSLTTTIQVVNAAVFPNPAQGQFKIKIGNELLRVTGALSGNKFTVQRGIEGTTAVAHLSNDVVVHPQSLDNQSVKRSFTLTVTNFNDPPTLDLIPMVNAVEAGGLISIGLDGITAGGNGTESSQPLKVTAISRNTAAIPTPSVSYVSSQTMGTLTFTPTPDAVGTFTIDVIVEDGGPDNNLSTSEGNNTFMQTLTVEIDPGDDDAPVIDSVPTQVFLTGTNTEQTVNLSGIGAGPFESGPVTVNFMTANTTPGFFSVGPAISYVSPDQNGLLTLTPTGIAGSSDITLTVTDSAMQTVTTTFTVKVVGPPTLAPISGTSPIVEESGLQTFNLSGISSGNIQPAQVTAVVVSNPDLLENLTPNYVAFSSTGTVTFNPIANKSGTATIKVTVTNSDNASVSQTFLVTVNALNDQPTLDQPTSPLNMSEDQPNVGVINLTGITAGPLEFQHLRVIATSNNTALVTASVVYTNANPIGSVNVTPKLNAVGSTTIDIQVQDAGFDGMFGNMDDAFSAVRSVTVFVAASNDDPTLANIGNVTVAEDSGEKLVTLTGISAGFGESQTLTFSATLTSGTAGLLVADPTFVYTPGTDIATLKFTPALNATGTATYTVTLKDDTSIDTFQKMVTKTITITVTPKNDAPTFDTVTQPSATVTLDENSPLNTVVMPIEFDDIDTPFNLLTFAFLGGNNAGAFKVQYNNVTGVANLVVANADALNFEQTPTFNLDVRIFDSSAVAPIQQFATRTFTVNLINLAEMLVVGPTNWSGSDGLLVKLVGTKVHVLNARTLADAVPAHELSMISDILVYGRQNVADVLTVDYSGGDPVPAGGLDFNGQNGLGDVIKLANASLLTTTDLTLTGAKSGMISDSGINTLTLTEVEAITFDTSANSGTINFLFSDAANLVTIADDVTTNNGLSVMTSTSAPTVTFPVAATVVVELGDGNDSLTINSIDTQSSTPISVNGGDGNDTLKAPTLAKTVWFSGGLGNDVLAGGTAADQLYGNEGNDSISGGLGDDDLDGGIDDGIGATDVNCLYETANVDFTLTNTNLVGVGTDTLANFQIAKLTGGIGNNIFTVSDWTGGGTLTGSTGTDRIVATRDTDMTLSSSSLVSPGYGTLTLATIENALLTGGGSDNKIRANAFTLGSVTLLGGDGNDVLIGGSKADSLFGGNGNDLLIGGADKDTLSGDADDDFLIGGTSSVSGNVTALNAIMAEWISGNAYATRVANLTSSTSNSGANGTTKLTASNDNAADRLTGGSELDLFFSSSLDVLVDFNAGIGELKKTI